MANVDWDEFDRGLDEYLEGQHNSHLRSLGGDGPIDPTHPRCVVCGQSPADIPEYTDIAIAEEYFDADGKPDPIKACIREEGTFNRSNGHYFCTADYIKAGQPTGVAP